MDDVVKQCDILLVSPLVESSSEERQRQQQQQQQHLLEYNTERQFQDRFNVPIEEQNLIQNLHNQMELLENEQKMIFERRCQLQKQIQQMETRRTELAMTLEKERVELQLEEKKYIELETDLVGFKETFQQIKCRREMIEKAKEKKRMELTQLQAIVEHIREETNKSEKTQNDYIQEIETRTKELENERSTFASTMKKATSNISRLRETIEQLKECNRKEAAARTATLVAAKQAIHTGKCKLTLLLSDDTRKSTPKSELKTVYWSPNPNKKKRTKNNSRASHSAARQEHAGNLKSGSNYDDLGKRTESETSTEMEVYETPVQHRHSRRASRVDLKSQGDSLSRIGGEKRQLSSVEKTKQYGDVRKQLLQKVRRTDSLADSIHERRAQEFSPQCLTYMGHEILRKRQRHR